MKLPRSDAIAFSTGLATSWRRATLSESRSSRESSRRFTAVAFSTRLYANGITAVLRWLNFGGLAVPLVSRLSDLVNSRQFESPCGACSDN